MRSQDFDFQAATPRKQSRPAIVSNRFLMTGFSIAVYLMFIHVSLRFTATLTGEQFWTISKPSEVLAALGVEGVMIVLLSIGLVWILLCDSVGRRRRNH